MCIAYNHTYTIPFNVTLFPSAFSIVKKLFVSFFFSVFLSSFHSYLFDSISIVTFVSVSNYSVCLTLYLLLLVDYCLCLYQQQFYFYYFFFFVFCCFAMNLFHIFMVQLVEWLAELVQMFSSSLQLMQGLNVFYMLFLMCCVYRHFSFILIPILAFIFLEYTHSIWW